MARKLHSTRPFVIHYRRRQRPTLTGPLVGAVAVLAAAAAIAWQGPNLSILLADAAPAVTVTATITPAPTMEPTPTVEPTVAATPTVAPQVEEGHDYSFMDVFDGEPVRWACGAPIRVATNGDVPAGTQSALEEVVTVLRGVSNLPLTVIGPDSAADITVHYAAPGTTRGHITLGDGTNLGKAGPISTNGRITAGVAVLRNDVPTTDPNTAGGKSVLMHELIHTLGMSHAHESTDELMTPTHATGSGPELGPGDTAGLQRIGC